MATFLSLPEAGELVMLRVVVTASQLEDVLETLAELPFPVNPDLRHQGMATAIEFPAYSGQLDAVRSALAAHDLDLESINMLEAIRCA